MKQERIPISLKESTPSTLTAKDLQKQLHLIGLHCEQTSVENLQHHMEDVLDNLSDSSIQGFGIQESEGTSGGMTMSAVRSLPVSCIQNNWKPSDVDPCQLKLNTIGMAANFDYLLKHYPGFSGKKTTKRHEKTGDTIDAFKQFFIEIAESICETLIHDLDRRQMEAIFATIIQPIEPGSDDYDSGIQNRIIFLIDDYDSSTRTCNGIGVLNLEFRIIIHNYKDKEKKDKKNYLIDITVRTSLYRCIDELDAEINFLNPKKGMGNFHLTKEK